MPACQWCGTDIGEVQRGNQIKKYCNGVCRSAMHKAARIFGLSMESDGYVKLKAWYDAYLRGIEK